MPTDRFEGRHNSYSPLAVAAFEDAVFAVAAHRPIGDSLVRALAADPGLISAHLLNGFGALMLGRAETAASAASAYEAARGAAQARKALTGSEAALLQALGDAVAGHTRRAANRLEAHVDIHPEEFLCGKIAHALRFMLGDASGMLRLTSNVVQRSPVSSAGYGFMLGCHAFEPQGAAATVARAIRLALRAPMGPVLIQIAPDTAAKTAADGEMSARPARPLAVKCDTESDGLLELARLIGNAERPLILAGLEAARDGAGAALLALMERRRIPLITTYKAKGLVDETHPLALGGAGLSPLADKELLPLPRTADLVLLLGYDPIEMRAGWMDPFAPDAEIVEISACPADHAMHAATARIEAPPRALLEALLRALPDAPAKPAWPNGEPAVSRERLRARFAPPDAWGPHTIFDALQRSLPETALVTVDSGAHRILLSQQLLIRRPLGLMQSAGFCTMGAAIPLAAGAKVARPEAPAVAVLGDGGLEMGLGELATLRDEGLAVVIIVLQDESLALIELKQAQAGLARAGVALGRSKFEDVAAALGGRAWRVNAREEFEAAFAAALGEDRFSLIICDIQVSDYAGTF